MANDIFGGLGGLMKGLTGFMPKDDPNVKLLNAQTEIADLEEQELKLYAEIGKQAYQKNPSAWPQADALDLVRRNLEAAKARQAVLAQEQQAAQQAKESAAAASTCPSCGCQNPEGTRFCRDCGAKLGAPACPACGAKQAPGTRFCGECGGKLEG